MMSLMRAMLWRLLYPLRLWIRWAPWDFGKGFATRALMLRVLPQAPASFDVTIAGAVLTLYYQETLGFTTLLRGPFEASELAWIAQHVARGACVVDVGANIGWFTCALAQAVGPQGTVWAFEPAASNLLRLRAHLARNGLQQVTVFDCALAEHDGAGTLLLADDGAYPSLVAVAGRRATGATQAVPVRALAEIWSARGAPDIAFIKIDVEGGELEVLKGAEPILRTQRPRLLVEANGVAELMLLTQYLTGFGYAQQPTPAGFRPWNYLFFKV